MMWTVLLWPSAEFGPTRMAKSCRSISHLAAEINHGESLYQNAD